MTARGPRAARRGFTLVEGMIAFMILAMIVTVLMTAQRRAVELGGQALDMRDLRVMADTVFRRIVYEHWLWDDGRTGHADEWYADFVDPADTKVRDRWKIYRLTLRKRKGLVAGTDPSGATEALFGAQDLPDARGAAEPRSPASTGSTSTEEASAAGEPAYLLELNVYLRDEDEPQLTLRSVVPVPESEREEGK